MGILSKLYELTNEIRDAREDGKLDPSEAGEILATVGTLIIEVGKLIPHKGVEFILDGVGMLISKIGKSLPYFK